MNIHDDIAAIMAIYIKKNGDIVLVGICVCMVIFISKKFIPRALKFQVLEYCHAYTYMQ